MRAVIHLNSLAHQQTHGGAMKSGLEAHGIHVDFAAYDKPVPCDFAVVWGAPSRHPHVAQSNKNILVMEAGHLGGRAKTRLEYTSCGWNGLARRGKYPEIEDGGERWRKYWGHLMQEWKQERGSYALLFGQVKGDAAINGISLHPWMTDLTQQLAHRGYSVRYRPHPVTLWRDKNEWHPVGSRLSRSGLEEDIQGATICLTYNSTAAVESVLAGVPTITYDEGAMAWPVTTHTLGPEPIRPDRTEWAHKLAWCQWTLEEITSGVAWDYLRRVVNL